MKYRIIDHTADLGLHVFGADPSELFATAARAMFDIMVSPEFGTRGAIPQPAS